MIDTTLLKQQVDMLTLAEQHTTLRKVGADEWQGPCPFCGGTDRFRVQPGNHYFACRQCGKSGDQIAFVQALEGLTFTEAAQRLGGGAIAPATAKAKPVAKAAQPYVWDEPTRRREAIEQHELLVGQKSRNAREAMTYLEGRGIAPATLAAFKVGCCEMSLPETWNREKKESSYPKQTAITLPWFNRDGALLCVKYRFLETHTYTDRNNKEQTANKTSRGQMSGNVFGWQAIKGPGRCNLLIMCEGEINALSLWQAGQGAFDVLSIGSQSNSVPQGLIDFAQTYAYRLVWADEKEVAHSAARMMRATAMQSPKGLDANDLLKAGQLDHVLSRIFAKMGYTLAEPEPEGWGDLTRWVGATIDGETWEGLQAECKARYGAGFTFLAEQVADGWHVRRFASAGWRN